MTRQRLAEATKPPTGDSGPMMPGDVRHINIRDQVTKEVLGTLTLHRTNRPYAYDLCDAYNAARTNPELEWFVDPAGQVKLGYRPEWSARHARELDVQTERERRKFNWRQEHPIAEAAE